MMFFFSHPQTVDPSPPTRGLLHLTGRFAKGQALPLSVFTEEKRSAELMG
jgi:hypothetical protein